MIKVHRLPDMDRIEREASERIARLNADDVSADDRARFEAWCRAHPLHARAYDELSATWCEFTAAGPLVRAVSFGQSMNEAAKVVRPRRRWLWAAAAAVAIVAAGLAWHTVRAPGATFETAIGEHATISLPDGSTLELNSNSLAHVDYSERARVIHLERGEAFFKVMHDTSRPFWVVGDDSWVRAVGTAFNVDLRGNGVRVTVSEGTVKVGAADAGSRAPSDEALSQAPVSVVTAGQEVDMHGSAAAIHTLRSADIARTEAWRSGSVYFENQPLSDVVEEIARYTSLRLIVNDEALRRLPVGGTFQANPQGAEAFLSMLKDGFGVNIRRETGRVYIESAPAKSRGLGESTQPH
jgi:transmembrane sensor